MQTITDIDTILVKFADSQHDNLIPILEMIQEEKGYITEEAIVKVSKFLQLPASKVFGVATFYDYFHFQPKARFQFKICNGTACYLNGINFIAQELENELKIKPGQITRDGVFGVEIVSCMGTCSSSPVLMVNNEHFSNVTASGLKKIIEDCKNKINKS